MDFTVVYVMRGIHTVVRVQVVGRLAGLVPPGTVNPNLSAAFLPHVEAQPFLRILHNENPLDTRIVDAPQVTVFGP